MTFLSGFKIVWMKKNLADRIAALDPYNYTLEGLRSLIIQFIEERIK